MKIVFTGGGTGGHVYPGLSVIERLREKGFTDIVWIGTKGGVEQQLAERAGVPFYGISTGKLRRYFSLQNILDAFKFLLGVFQAKLLLSRLKPDLLFSKGGFAAVPAVWAAGKRTPVWIHESDRDPGLATRLSVKKADRIFVAYQETVSCFPPAVRPDITVSGNPVRKDFFAADPKKGLDFCGFDGKKPVIFAVGGSLGAKQVNDLVESLASSLGNRADIIHQTGEEGFSESSRPGYVKKAFIREEYPHVLACADFVIGRAGAGSLWEFAVCGKPSLLIPLGTASSRGDQILNAAYFRDKGAALVLDPGPDEIGRLEKMVASLLDDPSALQRMSKACRELCPSDAAEFIASQIAQARERE
jgi:UDP-N-acetylglucosamine--N-acetylmuramyl-(pentapeptide) pyrophosphoryl-undecaprenol N-acetylglucosamine transferase